MASKITGQEMSLQQVKTILGGKIKIFEDEFPCDGVTHEEFQLRVKG